MSVTQKLIALTSKYFDKYGCYPGDFEAVLLDRVSFQERQQRASRFIESILTKHGKEKLRSYVAELVSVAKSRNIMFFRAF